jgi:hypothetical protein
MHETDVGGGERNFTILRHYFRRLFLRTVWLQNIIQYGPNSARLSAVRCSFGTGHRRIQCFLKDFYLTTMLIAMNVQLWWSMNAWALGIDRITEQGKPEGFEEKKLSRCYFVYHKNPATGTRKRKLTAWAMARTLRVCKLAHVIHTVTLSFKP